MDIVTQWVGWLALGLLLGYCLGRLHAMLVEDNIVEKTRQWALGMREALDTQPVGYEAAPPPNGHRPECQFGKAPWAVCNCGWDLCAGEQWTPEQRRQLEERASFSDRPNANLGDLTPREYEQRKANTLSKLVEHHLPQTNERKGPRRGPQPPARAVFKGERREG